MNYASKLWSIERDPKNVDYDWIVRNAFHVKPIFSALIYNRTPKIKSIVDYN